MIRKEAKRIIVEVGEYYKVTPTVNGSYIKVLEVRGAMIVCHYVETYQQKIFNLNSFYGFRKVAWEEAGRVPDNHYRLHGEIAVNYDRIPSYRTYEDAEKVANGLMRTNQYPNKNIYIFNVVGVVKPPIKVFEELGT